MKIGKEHNCSKCSLNWMKYSYKIERREEIRKYFFKEMNSYPSECLIRLCSKIRMNKWKWFVDKELDFIPCEGQESLYEEIMKMINDNFELE